MNNFTQKPIDILIQKDSLLKMRIEIQGIKKRKLTVNDFTKVVYRIAKEMGHKI